MKFVENKNDGEPRVEQTEDQKKAVEVTDRNVVVSAGAGTGKTAVLVARFVNLVRSGQAEVNHILTITFTDKAAEEMKGRIAEEFDRLGMRKERSAVETSYISTIHSFCSRLIKENPFAAGVDPGFEVMDDMDRQLMLGGLFEELFSEGGEYFLELGEHYGEDAVRKAIIAYMDLCRSMGRGIEYVKKLLAEPELLNRRAQMAADERAGEALSEVREVVERLSALEASGGCEVKRQDVVALKDSLSDVSSFRKVAEAMASATARMPVVPKKGDRRAECMEVRELLSRLAGMLRKEKSAIFFDGETEQALLPCKVALLKGAALFWTKYEQRKKESGKLDYEDLQLIARGLLRDNRPLRREYVERFRYVLVDEFQDVNWLQKELIDLLTSGKNLFAVGDARQSIYGFRNADVEIFEELVEKCQPTSRTHFYVSLNENFRSAENLIHFINFFFSRLWSKGETPGRGSGSGQMAGGGAKFECLRYARKGREEPAPSLGGVEIMLFEEKDAGDEAREDSEGAREREARSVAARIVGAVEEGRINVYDEGTHESRGAGYGDVAVLCRTRATYSAYAEAFAELGVPFCMVGGQSFYDRQEVADLINLLRVVDNPLRDIPLAAILRSPFVGVKDETLLLLRHHVENRLDSPYVMEALREIGAIREIADEERRKLLEFLNLLNDMRKRRDSMRLHELVKAFLDSTPYLTRTIASRGGMQKGANVRKFLDILREYDAREGGGIGGFLRFYELMRYYGPQEEEAALEAFSGNAVKLMTIHGAKGLEFPVVIVADMGRRFNFDRDKFLVSRKMEIGCDTWEELAEESCGRRLVFEERKERQLGEEKRLLYVAMTRARDHLILAGSYRRERDSNIDSARCPMDWLMAIVETETGLPESGSSAEVELGRARVRVFADVSEEATPRAGRRSSVLERYFERIAAGEELPVADALKEKLFPEVQKVLDRIAFRRTERVWSPPAEVSVSQLMLFEECPYRFFLKEIMRLPDEEVMRKLGLCDGTTWGIEKRSVQAGEELPIGTRKREFGEMVHACLEQIDLRAAEPENVRKAIARYFSSGEEADAADRLIRNFLDSAEGGRLRKAKELYREIAVKGAVEKVVISGVIDVLYLDETDRWTILDFKTGAVQPENARQQKAYDFQMLLYAFLVEQATGTRPARAIIHYLASGASRAVSTDAIEAEATRNRTAEIIDAIGRRQFGKAQGVNCGYCDYARVCRPERRDCSSTEEGSER